MRMWEEDLKSENLQVGYLNDPPWLISEAHYCHKLMTKKNRSEEEIEAKFQEHDSIHSHQEKIFTDGSQYSNGVGYAVVEEDLINQAKWPNSA